MAQRKTQKITINLFHWSIKCKKKVEKSDVIGKKSPKNWSILETSKAVNEANLLSMLLISVKPFEGISNAIKVPYPRERRSPGR